MYYIRVSHKFEAFEFYTGPYKNTYASDMQEVKMRNGVVKYKYAWVKEEDMR